MIVPAIIPQSKQHLVESLALVSFAPAVQIDVVDGKFVSAVSWPYLDNDQIEIPLSLPDIEIEIDLMVADPLAAAHAWIAVGVKRFVVHIESVDEVMLAGFFELKRTERLVLGLSANNDVPREVLTQYIDQVDFIQLMGIATIGEQGLPFDERVLPRIEYLRGDYPTLEIAIDGSVGLNTLPLLKAAGADRFAVGSAILNALDPSAAYEELVDLEVSLS